MARILIVERVPFMRNIAHFAVECGGHEVIGEAEDGKQAIELCERLLPDLVILAIILPKINGIEVLTKLKEICPQIKVIICSSIHEERMIDLAITRGADSYIEKPFHIINFVQAVNQVLGIDKILTTKTNQELLFSEKEELEKIAAKVLTKTLSAEELESFVQRIKKMVE